MQSQNLSFLRLPRPCSGPAWGGCGRPRRVWAGYPAAALSRTSRDFLGPVGPEKVWVRPDGPDGHVAAESIALQRQRETFLQSPYKRSSLLTFTILDLSPGLVTEACEKLNNRKFRSFVPGSARISSLNLVIW